MSNSPLYMATPSEARRLRADTVRMNAWNDVQELIKQRRYGAAYRRMVNACAQAWRIECKQENLNLP